MISISKSASPEQIKTLVPAPIIYLQNSGTSINGIQIWGSPMTPTYFNMAFNRNRGEAIARYWDMIPDNTDILITHGPMYRALDRNFEGMHVGCKDLALRVLAIKPKVHIFGHIHPAYGTVLRSGIRYINASMVNDQYQIVNTPVTFEP